MTDAIERTINGLTVRIDTSLCVGFGQCVDESELAFRLDDDVVEFADPERETREQLLQACRVCPVEALIVLDSTGTRLVP